MGGFMLCVLVFLLVRCFVALNLNSKYADWSIYISPSDETYLHTSAFELIYRIDWWTLDQVLKSKGVE